MRRPVRRALVIAVVLAAAGAAAWWTFGRGDDVPAAGEGADASEAAGEAPAQAGLEVTKDPARRVFTREETLVGKSPPGELRGVVDGPAGAPLGGLRVTARSRIPFRPAATAVTQADGAFRLQGVEDGQVDVLLGDVPAGWSAPSALASAGGAALRLRLERARPKEKKEAVAFAVTVRDAAGRPVAKARVKVQGRRDEKNFTMTDSDATDEEGVAHVQVEDPEAHLWLAVERPEGRDDVFDLEIDGWKAKDETLTLRPAARLTGTLVLSEGAPFAWGHVAWRQKSGEWKPAQLDADGGFQSPQLQPGLVQVVAFDSWVDEPFPPDTRVLDVDPSKGPVRLIAAAPSPGWVAVRFGPLEGSHLSALSMGRVAADRRVVDLDWPWRNVQEGQVVLFRAISRASRYQVYARRADGKIAFATDLRAGSDKDVLDLPWTEPKRLGVIVQWPSDARMRPIPAIAQGIDLIPNLAVDGKPVAYDPAAFGKQTTEFVFEGIPDGIWTVLLRADNREEIVEGSVDIAAGSTGRLDVRRSVPAPLR